MKPAGATEAEAPRDFINALILGIFTSYLAHSPSWFVFTTVAPSRSVHPPSLHLFDHFGLDQDHNILHPDHLAVILCLYNDGSIPFLLIPMLHIPTITPVIQSLDIVCLVSYLHQDRLQLSNLY